MALADSIAMFHIMLPPPAKRFPLLHITQHFGHTSSALLILPFFALRLQFG